MSCFLSVFCEAAKISLTPKELSIVEKWVDWVNEQENVDVFIAMSRKAACFVRLLRDCNIINTKIRIVSDRILDEVEHVPISPEDRIIILEDVIITGTSIRRVLEKLKNIYLVLEENISVCPIMVDEDQFNHEILQEIKSKYNYLNQDVEHGCHTDVLHLCSGIVKALSVSANPYDIDFPEFHTISIPITESYDEYLRPRNWEILDTTKEFQLNNEVYAYTLHPSDRSLRDFYKKFFVCDEDGKLDVHNLFAQFKLRCYVQKNMRDLSWDVKCLSFCVIKEISYESLNILYNAFYPQAKKLRDKGTGFSQAILDNIECLTRQFRFRLVQYVLALCFADYWASLLSDRNINLHLKGSNCDYIFTEGTSDLLKKAWNDRIFFSSPHIENIVLTSLDDNVLDERQHNSLDVDILPISVRLRNRFVSKYYHCELAARYLARENSEAYIGYIRLKEYGILDENWQLEDLQKQAEIVKKYAEIYGEQLMMQQGRIDASSIPWEKLCKQKSSNNKENVLERLQQGYSWTVLIKHLRLRSLDDLKEFSRCMDSDIDAGIIIPIVEDDREQRLMRRAFRHGETSFKAEEGAIYTALLLDSFFESFGEDIVIGDNDVLRIIALSFMYELESSATRARKACSPLSQEYELFNTVLSCIFAEEGASKRQSLIMMLEKIGVLTCCDQKGKVSRYNLKKKGIARKWKGTIGTNREQSIMPLADQCAKLLTTTLNYIKSNSNASLQDAIIELFDSCIACNWKIRNQIVNQCPSQRYIDKLQGLYKKIMSQQNDFLLLPFINKLTTPAIDEVFMRLGKTCDTTSLFSPNEYMKDWNEVVSYAQAIGIHVNDDCVRMKENIMRCLIESYPEILSSSFCIDPNYEERSIYIFTHDASLRMTLFLRSIGQKFAFGDNIQTALYKTPLQGQRKKRLKRVAKF